MSSIRYILDSYIVRTWYTKNATHSLFLQCFSLASHIYRFGLIMHQRSAMARRKQLPALVISVGNMVAGGTGKTPLTLWLAKKLHETGWQPAIVSRGYGRKSKSTERVELSNISIDPAYIFGDEAVLMATKAHPIPVWVGRNRYLAGSQAIDFDRVNIIIIDDGFQHIILKRDLDLVLIDAEDALGNGMLLPLGPLREPPHHLIRADAIVITRAEDRLKTQKTVSFLEKLVPGKPIFRCRHKPGRLKIGLCGPSIPLESLAGKKGIAFAGIAHPSKFFDSLFDLGLHLVHKCPFPDHLKYGRSEIEMLFKAVRRWKGDYLITTEKDMVRIPSSFHDLILSVELDIQFLPDERPFRDFLHTSLGRS